ncbi:hypothetical protein PMAYCL1PPCAC_33415, partial [Pristionchus mayeri]
ARPVLQWVESRNYLTPGIVPQAGAVPQASISAPSTYTADSSTSMSGSVTAPPLLPCLRPRVSHRMQGGMSIPHHSRMHRGMPEIVRGALPGSLDDILSAYQHHHDDHAGAFHHQYHIDSLDPLEYQLNQHDYNEYPNVEHNPSSLDDVIVDDSRPLRPISPAIDYSLPGTTDRGVDGAATQRVQYTLRRPMQQRVRNSQPRRMRYAMQDNVRGVVFTPSTRDNQPQQQQPLVLQPQQQQSAPLVQSQPQQLQQAQPAGYRTIRRVHARSAAGQTAPGRVLLYFPYTIARSAPRFRGIRALFARVSTRVRAALRSVSTADSPSAAAAAATAANGKQPAATTAHH